MSTEITNNNIAQSMNIFMANRKPDDVDLVCLVGRALKEYLGDNVFETFNNDGDIKSVANAMPEVQRVIINRYFSSVLFRFRFHHEVDVVVPLSNLIADGTYTDWFYCFKTYVMPFLKEHNVFNLI